MRIQSGSHRSIASDVCDDSDSGLMGEIPDRELHDRVIRFLTDANVRSSPQVEDLLDGAEVDRAERFSRFLARRYYRDRLMRGFRYSRVVGPQSPAHAVVESSEFEAILGTCVLGSFETAERVGELALRHLSHNRSEHRWWAELLEYERAFFLQLATSENRTSTALPQKNVSAIMRGFPCSLPELLAALSSSLPKDDGNHDEVTLLFSRTRHGKIYVAELDSSTAAVFQAVDGRASADEIAALCNLSAEENQRILTTLSNIGSVVLAGSQTLKYEQL